MSRHAGHRNIGALILVTSHVGADFDALASMVAARKLHPGSIAAFSGGMDRNVREFVNLFDESLDVRNPTDVELDAISRLIVVDTQHARRLGRFRRVAERGVPVELYDHHPPLADSGADTMSVERAVTRSLGATTTLLAQILREERIAIEPFDATLFALGIYEETGSLVFSHTTPEDVEMVAYLLEQGANLDVVSDYINRSLTEKQRELLNHLILNTEYHTVQGVRIAIAQAAATEYVDEIALLTHKLCDIENVGAVFALTESKHRQGSREREGDEGSTHEGTADTSVFLVARSKVDSVDVSAILAPLGGGGHHRAASAMLKNVSLRRARELLLEALEAHVIPQARAADIMEYPVRTVDVDTTVEEAGRVMLRYGYSGLVVVAGGEVAGIVSRRDVDKAKHHCLHAAPVHAVMTAGVPVATLDTSLLELQEMMVASKVGRIPIVEIAPHTGVAKPRLVGVVTRSGLLQALYGQERKTPPVRRRNVTMRRDDIAALMQERLPEKILQQARTIGEIAQRMHCAAYVVGGFVRDLLLGVSNLDIDVVCHGSPPNNESDGIALAQAVVKEWSGRLIKHERFGTAVVVLPDGQKIDFATARAEFYKFPAALPDVEYASIQEDLYRRDFTINAMAVQLNPGNFGLLLDFFGGREDLEAGIVRVLHNLSFVEDPTRIIRAVRLEQRHGFAMDRQTESLISQAADIEMFSRLTRERMRDELILLLSEPDPVPAIHRMAHLDILRRIHPRLCFDENVYAILQRTGVELRQYEEPEVEIERAGREQSRGERPGGHTPCGQRSRRMTRWLAFFLPLLDELQLSEVKSLAQDMKLGNRVTQIVTSATIDVPLIYERLMEEPSPSEARRFLLPVAVEVLLYAAAKAPNERCRTLLHQFLYEWQWTRTDITGKMLLQYGVQPGPEMGRALDAALDAKLDGLAKTEQEQLQAALRRVKNSE